MERQETQRTFKCTSQRRFYEPNSRKGVQSTTGTALEAESRN